MRAADSTGQARRYAFGHAVRVRREALGLSQAALAERAGFDRQTINRTECGQYSILLDRVFVLADALGCTAAELLAGVEAPRHAAQRGSAGAA